MSKVRSPLFKIKKEILRPFAKARLKIDAQLGGFRRWRYDRCAYRLVTEIEGLVPVSQDIAVLLIFQPKGLLPSLFVELEYLSERGLSCVVVANHPLSPNDIERLRKWSYLIIQRPNLGYDFGGYRQGILALRKRSVAPRNLYVMNDSVWFPTIRETDLIESARDSKADLFGVYESADLRRVGKSYIHSYFYRFGQDLVCSKAFVDYWTQMPFFASKRLVIEYCEMTLTNEFREQGFSVDTYFKPHDLRAATSSLSKAQLVQIARLFRETEPRLKPDFGTLLDESNDIDWEDRKAKLLLEDLFSEMFVMSHPLVTIGKMHSPFVKKLKGPHYRMLRREIFSQGLDTLLEPTIRNEIAGWDQR